MADTVLIERDGPIVTVVLNRPEKLNAIDKATWIAPGDAIEALAADDAEGAPVEVFAATLLRLPDPLREVEAMERAAKRVLKLKPEFSLAEFAESQPYKEQKRLNRLIAQLRSAGLE